MYSGEFIDKASKWQGQSRLEILPVEPTGVKFEIIRYFVSYDRLAQASDGKIENICFKLVERYYSDWSDIGLLELLARASANSTSINVNVDNWIFCN